MSSGESDLEDGQEGQILETVRRFVSREVRPHVAALERAAQYPEPLVARMQELGLFGLVMPERFGGLELPLNTFAAVMEELAAGWMTLAAYVNSHSTVAFVLSKYGKPEQRQRYLPPMAEGAIRGALALTEPGAGSDLQAISTVARPSDGGFILNGNKIFVKNGERASLLLVLATTDPTAEPAKRGMSLLLVQKDVPGVTVAGAFRQRARSPEKRHCRSNRAGARTCCLEWPSCSRARSASRSPGDALRIRGGYSYIKEFQVERMFREAPLYIVGEGTNDIQKLIIAHRLIECNEGLAPGLGP